MPRENSFSDSDGRSLTPDLELPEGNAPPRSPMVAVEPAGLRSITSAPATSPTGRPIRPTFAHTTTPIDRFRATVHKVIRLRRTSTVLADRGGIGAEPGADPRRDSAFLTYGHLRQNCLIEVVDYSSVRSSFGRMTNKSFIDMMSNKEASERESWVKVRWINIGGVDWGVLSALALRYDLHPLALEDVLHQHTHARSKADYYNQHLFLRILCHALSSRDDGIPDTMDPTIPRSSSPGPMTANDEKGVVGSSEEDEELTVFGGSAPVSRFSTPKGRSGIVKRRPWGVKWAGDVENAPGKNGSLTNLVHRGSTNRRRRVQQEKTIEELKKGERVNVKISPMYIFLLRDGTVISIHPATNLEYTTPITNRLRHRDTGLRATADASLLVQSLLDLIVDSALEVVDEYHSKLLKLEHDILLKPKMKTVRYLHILSGDLILHKRTLDPIKTLIYGLRRYDLDRCAALVDMSQPGGALKVEGFMSHKSKIYLADVHDHMEYILTSLDMFASIAENLINFTFNMISNDMNEVMRRLTLATIIFLPLTLLTGYFGMNFDSMWSIMHGHTDLVFWEIAIPLMSIVIPVFLYGDVLRMVHYVKKKLLVTQVEENYK